MTDTIEVAGYIVHTAEAIYGTGETRLAAWEDARQFFDAEFQSDDPDDSMISLATAALIADVKDRGGAISWSEVDGVACTVAEANDEAG